MLFQVKKKNLKTSTQPVFTHLFGFVFVAHSLPLSECVTETILCLQMFVQADYWQVFNNCAISEL